MRMISRKYHQTLELFVKAKLNLQTLADKVMLGIDDLVKNNQSNLKLTDFMNRYWHFDNILAMGEKRFCRDYVNWTKNRDKSTINGNFISIENKIISVQ